MSDIPKEEKSEYKKEIYIAIGSVLVIIILWGLSWVLSHLGITLSL